MATELKEQIPVYIKRFLGARGMNSSVTASLLFSERELPEEAIICYKNISIDAALIASLEERLDRIYILKLEFCNLTELQIETLSNLLVGNCVISEVSVNGNPNESQNFYLLLHKTNILSLSLKFCAIDHKGIEKISKELYHPFESSLLHLNLSSNSIRNKGVKHIVHFLRINRTLLSLNLADNKIYDTGCLYLTLTLQKFSLNFEEIVVRRKVKFDILRNNMRFSSIAEIKSEEISMSPRRLSSKESSLISSEMIKNRNRLCSAIFNLLNHPFIWDPSEEKEDEYIYCQGNDVLMNLNLSYNRITREGLKCVIEMLHYQIDNYPPNRGILRISTEGNDFYDCEHILNKLIELLGLKSKKSSTDSKRKSHLSLRKRS